MKKVINQLSSAALVVAVVLTLSFSNTANASTGIGDPVRVGELKFIGKINDKPVFQLNLNNTEVDDVIITLRDDYGNALYSEKFKGTMITRKFLLNTEEINTDDVLRFEVRSTKNKVVEVYEINRNSRTIEEMVVNKIK